MTTTYVWTVTALSTMPTPTPDYVVYAQYTVTGTDGTITVETQGTSQFTANPDQTDYVPYADLTEAEVIGWVQDSLGQDTVEASLTAQIEAQKNPVQKTGLPWVTA